MISSTKLRKNAGFTIVELMIATLVFSVILVIITSGIIYITKTYYRGVTLNKTQSASEGILNSLAQAIQFSGGKVSWPQPLSATPNQPILSGRGCIGSQAYDFQLGYQVSTNPNGVDLQSPHALTLSPDVANCAETSGTFTAGTTELLSPGMRLTRLSITQESSTDNLYQVNVTVVYGDYDLLCDRALPANGPGGCSTGSPVVRDPSGIQSLMTSPTLACRPGEGSAYCAVSALSTVVQQRITIDG